VKKIEIEPNSSGNYHLVYQSLLDLPQQGELDVVYDGKSIEVHRAQTFFVLALEHGHVHVADNETVMDMLWSLLRN
jgi:hypothetical protein